MTQRILGIDPGLQITGYALVQRVERPALAEPRLVEAGVIRLEPSRGIESRLGQLHDELGALIVEHQPQVCAVEQLYAHYRHPRTAILMGHARGVILLTAAQHTLELVDLPATEVKKSLTGYGHASKQQMQQSVMGQCGLAQPPSPPDVADAIAIGICAARRLALAGVSG